MDDNEPVYVLEVRPLTAQQADHSWKAWYLEADWSVTAATKTAALHEVRDEFERRLTAGFADDDPDAALLAQHLASPISGVYAIEHDTYMRMRSGPNFQQKLDAHLAELDAKAT